MVHQASKLKADEKDKFLEWLSYFEFTMYKLPNPDCVIFLNMPPEFSKKLMEERANKITGTQEKDIHESNLEYLKECYNNSLYIAKKYEWINIDCIFDNKLKSIDEIHEEIYKHVKKVV
jgi:dTMP kinase